MREHNKRWLISKMKTSGSKRSHLLNGNYADERSAQKTQDLENLPQHESIKRTGDFYNGKINTDLLIRFLRGQVGEDWNDVHSEIISRIPARLLDYKEIVLWYVADKVEFKDGRLWNKRSQKYIWTDGPFENGESAKRIWTIELFEFYVDPETNKLIQIHHKSHKRMAKK
ncbi:hypothetical protein [Mucilaginibacter ginsenosidivorans]|uniref:Uncharacterized protein n=1 Tax=Mucilaginibacter ginsenosidivorans TaxID=398053 RepID=A0A5B8UWK8_9SPHI|nr:hypothetical protein [Mucilaginibacter ginsenosidivorans]QEC62796.1 hypothetical protein FRZ54_09445 [Mucilaginibacter ginsenosidivorans]